MMKKLWVIISIIMLGVFLINPLIGYAQAPVKQLTSETYCKTFLDSIPRWAGSFEITKIPQYQKTWTLDSQNQFKLLAKKTSTRKLSSNMKREGNTISLTEKDKAKHWQVKSIIEVDNNNRIRSIALTHDAKDPREQMNGWIVTTFDYSSTGLCYPNEDYFTENYDINNPQKLGITNIYLCRDLEKYFDSHPEAVNCSCESSQEKLSEILEIFKKHNVDPETVPNYVLTLSVGGSVSKKSTPISVRTLPSQPVIEDIRLLSKIDEQYELQRGSIQEMVDLISSPLNNAIQSINSCYRAYPLFMVMRDKKIFPTQ